MRKLFEVLEKPRIVSCIEALEKNQAYSLHLTTLGVMAAADRTVLQKELKVLLRYKILFSEKRTSEVGQPVYYALNSEKLKIVKDFVETISLDTEGV